MRHLKLVLMLLALACGQSSAQKRPSPVWGKWTKWTNCSAPCGGGVRWRERRCTNIPGDESSRCYRRKEKYCNEIPCATTASTAQPEPMRETTAGATTSTAQPEPMPETTAGAITEPPTPELMPTFPVFPEPSTVRPEPMPEMTAGAMTKPPTPEPMPTFPVEDIVLTPWGTWSDCEKPCGSGMRYRTRDCIVPSMMPECEKVEGEVCNTFPCVDYVTVAEPEPEGMTTRWPEPVATTVTWTEPVATTDYVTVAEPEPVPEIMTTRWPEPVATTGPIYLLPDWTEWSECDLDCGGGKKLRYRNCPTLMGGPMCTDIEGVPCNVQPCPSPPDGYTPWGDWTDCDLTCGGGTRYRNRVCLIPTGTGDCTLFQADMCNTQPCPMTTPWPETEVTTVTTPTPEIEATTGTIPMPQPEDTVGEKEYTQWTRWTICSAVCGNGFRYRVRECIKLNGKPTCEESQQETCYAGPCSPPEDHWLMCGRPDLSSVPYMEKTLSSPEESQEALNCMWTIRAPRGHRVWIVVDNYDAEEKLTLLEGEPYEMPYKEAKITTLSGHVESGTEYHSMGRAMTLRLQRGAGTVGSNFEIRYVAVEMDVGFAEDEEDFFEPPQDTQLWYKLYSVIMRMFFREVVGDYQATHRVEW